MAVKLPPGALEVYYSSKIHVFLQFITQNISLHEKLETLFDIMLQNNFPYKNLGKV